MPGNAVAITARNELAAIAREGAPLMDRICERLNVTELNPDDARHFYACLRVLADDLDRGTRNTDNDTATQILTDRAWSATEGEAKE